MAAVDHFGELGLVMGKPMPWSRLTSRRTPLPRLELLMLTDDVDYADLGPGQRAMTTSSGQSRPKLSHIGWSTSDPILAEFSCRRHGG